MNSLNNAMEENFVTFEQFYKSWKRLKSKHRDNSGVRKGFKQTAKMSCILRHLPTKSVIIQPRPLLTSDSGESAGSVTCIDSFSAKATENR